MRLLHGIHHRISHPTTVESLYSHPVDTVIAFTLLFACMALVGPMGMTSFVVASLLYTTVFALGHANLHLPVRAMAPLNHWARRHDAHHAQRNVNYGSITPFWDWLFRTAANSIRPWQPMQKVLLQRFSPDRDQFISSATVKPQVRSTVGGSTMETGSNRQLTPLYRKSCQLIRQKVPPTCPNRILI